MSLPGTPARSIMLSSSSTPSSLNDGSNSPQLTPRSKVKAMLAAIDEDSQSDHSEHAIRRSPLRKPLLSIERNGQQAEEMGPAQHAPQEDSEEDDEPIPPRGHVAARLNGQIIERKDSSANGGNEDDKENVYARVRKQLMQKRPRATSEVGQERRLSPKSPPATQRVEAEAYVNTDLSTIASNPSTPFTNRRPSPNLFLTASSASKLPEPQNLPEKDNASDDDLPDDPQTNNRFLELVARKRAEREARQAEQDAKKKQRRRHDSFDDGKDGGGTPSPPNSGDEEADRRLTQHNRPTRKASKKALEEMSRETQRMSRNMQLAHQAKTKKKITKESLLARFNFGGVVAPAVQNANIQTSSATTSSAPASDCEDMRQKDTPATSPLQPEDLESEDPNQMDKESNVLSENAVPSMVEERQDDLPDIMDFLSQPMSKLDKGKGTAAEVCESHSPPIVETRSKKFDFQQRPIKIHAPKLSPRRLKKGEDSDSDLEVMPVNKSKASRLAAFDRIPQGKAQDVRSLQTLRALAHLNSPPDNKGRKGRPSVSLIDLQSSLQKRARQQAVEERKAKIEDLKARGIIVQTAEEKEKEQIEVEDLLEKARREDMEIKEKEKRAAKQEKLANGEMPDLDDSSDDEDYEDGDGDEAEVELSGSEDEDVEMGDGEDLDVEGSEEDSEREADDTVQDEKVTNALTEDEASESSHDEADIDADGEDDGDSGGVQVTRPRRTRMILDEDDEADEVHVSRVDKPDESSESTGRVVEIPKLFQSKPNAMPMGMTQAFAATMADTQTQTDDKDANGEDSMAFLGSPPQPNLPLLHVEDSLLMVQDSQDRTLQPDTSSIDKDTACSGAIHLHFSQSQIRYDAGTQYSEIPDPTQDAGFAMSSPVPERFVPPSTVDTVILPIVATANTSPIAKKRGRLHRRPITEEETSDEDEQCRRLQTLKASDEKKAANAFAVMEKARKRAAKKAEFDKKKSEAKNMVEEQAQESEDEYAGLGGASDDESGVEEDVFVKEMMDENEVNVDERKLAALYA